MYHRLIVKIRVDADEKRQKKKELKGSVVRIVNNIN